MNPAKPIPSTSKSASLLEQAPWFARLTDAQQALARATVVERAVRAGECIARAGDIASQWIGVARGFLQMSVTGSDGSETALHFLREGDWDGEGSILKGERRRYDVVALRASEVCLMPATTFERLHAESVAFNHFLLANLNERMGVVTSLLEASRLLDPDMLVARCLSLLASGRLSAPLTIAQHQLASLCGLSRQRTNQALSSLRAQGIVQLEGQTIQVPDVERLARYAQV